MGGHTKVNLKSDALRIAPEVTRCVEAGPEGAELLLFGAPTTEAQDAELAPD